MMFNTKTQQVLGKTGNKHTGQLGNETKFLATIRYSRSHWLS